MNSEDKIDLVTIPSWYKQYKEYLRYQYTPIQKYGRGDQLKIKVLTSEDGTISGKIPTRAHPDDAGLDLYCCTDVEIPQQETVAVHTGVEIKLPKNTVGLVMSKSGLSRNLGISTRGGVIDEGYTGELIVLLRNEGFSGVRFSAGSKVAQLVILPVLYPEIKVVEELPTTDRGDGGFGSTGV